MNDTAPKILDYDHHSSAKDPRARWVLPGFLLGMVISGILINGLVASILLWQRMDYDATFYPWIDGLVVSAGFTIFAFLPSSLALGICLWLRRIIVKEVRFASFRAALLWGVLAGLYPLSLERFLSTSVFWSLAIFIGGLIWLLLISILAGFFLCYRSHLRE